jgi:hypothetical protein
MLQPRAFSFELPKRCGVDRRQFWALGSTIFLTWYFWFVKCESIWARLWTTHHSAGSVKTAVSEPAAAARACWGNVCIGFLHRQAFESVISSTVLSIGILSVCNYLRYFIPHKLLAPIFVLLTRPLAFSTLIHPFAVAKLLLSDAYFACV